MSRLYKRGNVYWFDFQMDGNRYRKSTGKTKRREAEEVLDSEREKAKAGECVGAKKIMDCTVAALADEYSKWVKFQKSYGSKRFFIKHIVETFGNLRVRPDRLLRQHASTHPHDRCQAHSGNAGSAGEFFPGARGQRTCRCRHHRLTRPGT